MDAGLKVLGPQLVKGKPVTLTRAKKTALAAWVVKFALMLQLVYPRDSRFVIPDADYPQFYADRRPSDLMMLWAGYMEPPGNMAARRSRCATTGMTRCSSTRTC